MNNEFKVPVENQNYMLLCIPQMFYKPDLFVIEIRIGSVEIGFTVDFTFWCALILTDFNLTQSFGKQTYRTKDSLELSG